MCNRLQRLTAASVLLASACASSSAEPTSNPNLEVYSWWKSAGEQAAFAALVMPFKVAHPGAKVTNVDREDSAAARGDLGGLLLLGSPPNTFQSNAGADLLRWAAVDYESQTGIGVAEPGFSLLADVGPLLRQSGALETMYPEVRRAVCARVDGATRYFGVPVNVHRINLLYFNRALVEGLGVTPDELFTLDKLCPLDLATERLPFRISIAANDNFSLLLLLFENLLLAVAGPSSYAGFFTGEPPPTWRAEMSRVLGCLWYLSRSFKSVREWFHAVDDVAAGRATMMVMGDWANPEFVRAAGAAELQGVVGRRPFPGTENYFAFTSDSFPLPLEAGSPEQTRTLLKSFADFETQLAFSAKKGSIPALRGGARAMLDAWGLESLAAFEDASRLKVLGTSGFFPSYVSQGRVTEELRALIDEETLADVPAATQRVLALLESSLPLFRTWQARLETCEDAP